MRNANVYLDMTDAPSEHIREAVQIVGAERIMFGTDLSAISVNYSYEDNFRALNGAELNAEELEWIAWRTANKVYQLGLEG
jgi:predicted TIM-barrel fold metal-dependent hydrolase